MSERTKMYMKMCETFNGRENEKPHTHWKSFGTKAVVDIREFGYFTRRGITASSSVKVRVYYDYN